jgi:hypothetical protein
MHFLLKGLVLASLSVILAGCASLMSSATERLATNLGTAIENHNDVETVRAGAPAYLLMIDGLIAGDPNNAELLLSGAKLYATYASAFVDDVERARRLSETARTYGVQALCLHSDDLCKAVEQPYDAFLPVLARTESDDLDYLYGFGTAFAAWIQANTHDWDAVAELPKLEALLRRVVELDDGYDRGGAHLYLGIMATLLPPDLGGKPEVGRDHFERAVELSEGKNYMAKVLFAKHYARLVFDQRLHDKLLQQVLDADPAMPDFTLSNSLAQEQARELLDGSAEYF